MQKSQPLKYRVRLPRLIIISYKTHQSRQRSNFLVTKKCDTWINIKRIITKLIKNPTISIWIMKDKKLVTKPKKTHVQKSFSRCSWIKKKLRPINTLVKTRLVENLMKMELPLKTKNKPLPKTTLVATQHMQEIFLSSKDHSLCKLPRSTITRTINTSSREGQVLNSWRKVCTFSMATTKSG